MARDKTPLPLADMLRDLAILRASDIDLSTVLPEKSEPPAVQLADDDKTRAAVANSFGFARETREAIKLMHRGEVDKQGAKIDSARDGLEELLGGLDKKP